MYSGLGCSVRTVGGLDGTNAKMLRDARHGGITLCVTGAYQHNDRVYKRLKDAGFIPVADYKNYNLHNGTHCRLWVAFGTGSLARKSTLLPGLLGEAKIEVAGDKIKLVSKGYMLKKRKKTVKKKAVVKKKLKPKAKKK